MRSDIYWLDQDGRRGGMLAVAPRPRGGDWLEDEVAAWKRAGVQHVVSLLQTAEARELELEEERSVCERVGITFTAMPVLDRGVPESALRFREVAAELARQRQRGTHVLVHCRQGIGRASMMAAAILTESGVDLDSALKMIEGARGRPIPDTDEQRLWLTRSLPMGPDQRTT